MNRDYYVYILYRPDGRPCYVGKGRKRRIFQHEWLVRKTGKHYNRWLGGIIKRAGGEIPKAKIATDLTEAEAHALEVHMIASLGRKAAGGPLVNLTDGGEGVSGYRQSDAERERSRQQALGNKYCVGRKASAESRELMRLAKLGTTQSAAAREKRRQSTLGKKRSEETKARLAEARRAHWARMTPEQRAERGRAIAAGKRAVALVDQA